MPSSKSHVRVYDEIRSTLKSEHVSLLYARQYAELDKVDEINIES